MSSIEAKSDAPAKDLIHFINSSPSPFHAVAETRQRLVAAGFVEISERDEKAFSELKPKGKYFFTRNQSTIVALAFGGKYAAGNGFVVLGAHTDSPCLKVKPVSKVVKHGCLQVGVEPYGGGLWHTWFDRDLSLAGRVFVETENGKFESRLVDLKKPILRIPNLAIHLQRDIYEKGFNPNKQTHVLPILATQIRSSLEKIDEKQSSLEEEHHPLLLKLLAEQLKVKVSQIRDFELCLYDTNPAQITGALDEFVSAARLDNLCMSYVSLASLLASLQDAQQFDNEECVRMCVLFDNEEIGSESSQGAGSNLLQKTFSRISGNELKNEVAIRKSFLVSADMAHACHPNYADLHEENHRPYLHKGLVLKENANLRYATNAFSSFYITELARKHKIPLQKFAVRNDLGCGSTIGPMLSASCGVRTVDVGVPQWSMHSVRETAATTDIALAQQLLTHFLMEYSALDKSVIVDKEQY